VTTAAPTTGATEDGDGAGLVVAGGIEMQESARFPDCALLLLVAPSPPRPVSPETASVRLSACEEASRYGRLPGPGRYGQAGSGTAPHGPAPLLEPRDGVGHAHGVSRARVTAPATLTARRPLQPRASATLPSEQRSCAR
jgi:hypothetical protein